MSTDASTGRVLPSSRRTAGGDGAPRGVVRALLALARPGQWPKNLLVLSAPAAAGVLGQPRVLERSALAGLAFVAASVAVYAANDVRDADDDRRHPAKRLRPVASGAVSTRLALGVAVGCAVAAVLLASLLGLATAALVVTYLVSSGLYVARLKHVPVVDVVVVACGFVLRALAGATASGLAVSNWFLLVSLFGALFVVSAKRRAELQRIGREAGTRPVLAAYTGDWLTQVVTLSLTGTVIAYASWAFQMYRPELVRPALAASVVPVLVVLLRYGLLVSQGHGERPEVTLARDRVVLLAGLAWAALVAWSIYLV